MSDLPRIRYLTPAYTKKIMKEIKGVRPYNLITRGRPVDMHWIIEHMQLPPEAGVLEFGGWPADNWRVAHANWKGLLVTDSFGWLNDRNMSANMPQATWEKALDECGVAHQQLDVQTMDYHEAFDGIFSVSVLEHVIDHKAGLKNIWNALIPGGLFVFTVEMNPYVMMQYDKGIYFRVYSQEKLVKMLIEAGFETNPEAEDFSDFDDMFQVSDAGLLRQPYKHFVSAGVLARKPR